MKYDGPFKVIHKLSLATYQLQLPVSYSVHSVLNIAHLKCYKTFPSKYGEHPLKWLQHEDFDTRPEYEVDTIVGECWQKGPWGHQTQQFKTRFTSYRLDADKWLTHMDLWNALAVLQAWEMKTSKRIEGARRAQAIHEEGRSREDCGCLLCWFFISLFRQLF
jgi:hypothetical protein